MKVISIGRSPENMIIIDDMMVSRRHALIRIKSFGKYELISSGTNGTKVNGNQVSPNVPYPLKRGDSVIFANVAPLDWSRVPDPIRPYKIGVIGVCIACVLALAIAGVIKLVNNYTGSDNDYAAPSGRTEQTDTITKSDGRQSEDTTNKQIDKESDDNAMSFQERFKAANHDNSTQKDTTNSTEHKQKTKKTQSKTETTKTDNDESTWGRR